MKHSLKKLLLALGLTAFCAAPFAVFDPVNDDSDLFRNNPNFPAARPNVLILLDNTANWSSGSKFTSEKTALVNTVAALDDAFNVGLMIFTQGGNCATGSTNGGYVRFGIRRLTTANKAALTSVVNSFTDASCGGGPPGGGDQGSGAAAGQALHESYLYFSGLTSRSGILQVKRDFFGSTVATVTAAASFAPHPFASGTAAVYTSPLTEACAKSYIIFISNGPFDNGDDSPSSGLFAHGTTGLVPNASGGSFSSWADEYADYFANTGVTVGGANSKVFMYAVEVDPVTTGQGPAHTQLLQAMATRGKGKYFGVTSATAGVAITDALLSIFTEIQAVNSVFAASTLPVSVNVRGTNLNQLYIGVFRPDAIDRPRWLGNLKAYQLKRDSVTNTVFTVDANLNPAINSSTGFITSSARSFWTDPNVPTPTYWGFRSASVNGIGGSSDSPDGDLVEKGGAAQQLRARYFASGVNGVSPSPSRPLYTCTQGTPYCNTHTPSTPSLLSATPFSVANADIDAGSLAIDTRLVSPLTAAVVKPITALVDRRPVTLNNASGAIRTVSTITTNTTAVAASSIINTRTVAVTSMSNNASTRSASFSKQGTLIRGALTSHLMAVGTTIVVTGTTDFNTTGTTITSTGSGGAAGNVFDYGSTSVNATQAGFVTTSNTTVNVIAPAHGFVSSPVGTPTVTIAGASPASFNGAKIITVINANEFSYPNTVAIAPTGTITAIGATTTVTVNFAAPHGLSALQSVVISGAVPTTYNGTYVIQTVPSATSFTYTTGSAITTANSGTVTATTSGTLATATVTAHGFANGATVTIAGASPAGFNGSFVIAGVTANTFDYTTSPGLGSATAAPLIQAFTALSGTVTGTRVNHRFSNGMSITIEGAAGAGHNGAFTINSIVDADTFTYTYATVGPFVAPGGTPTVRRTSSPRAYATMVGHGFGAANTTIAPFTVSGAVPAGYNGAYTDARVEDANTMRYTLTGAIGADNTGSPVTATTNGTTAVATSTAHGFIAGAVVTVAGATPSAFNGSQTVVSVPSADTFTYTLGSPQGAATGAITAIASGSGASERTNIINWVRGEDNFEDENANSSFGDTRASMHGDVLHSRPSVVNYNRRTSDAANIDNDVYIFYGGNDGVFRATKGGFGSSTGDPAMGQEVWGFIAKEHFGNLKRLRLNSPAISSNFKKPYFFDGPIGAYTLDANGDGMLDPDNARAADGTVAAATTGDKVWLFLTMRRGGRAIYALDVSKPDTPKVLWRRGCPSFSAVAADIDSATGCDRGWGELGQTWSEPKVITIDCSATSCPGGGGSGPALMFGAGYDPLVEDPDPSTVSCITAASVRVGGTGCSGGTVLTRSMGRGLFVVNAATGALIWHASSKAPASVLMPTGATYKQVAGMDYAISSDMAVVVGDPTPRPFRAYIGDAGGQMWRMDFGSANPANWTVKNLASIADHTTTVTVAGATWIPGQRKFQFAPDVIGATGFDMVITGSGDREHPFDSKVVNRVYAFKDKSQTAAPSVLNQPTITHATNVTFNGSSVKTLLDVSTQCIEIPGACSGTAPELLVGGTSASLNTSNALADTTNTGWFITLAAGEKQVGSTLASGGGIVQFGTNQPSASAGGGSCSPNLGVARQYTVNFLDGTAYNGTALSTLYVGGGFLPSPVLVFVGLGGASGTGSTSGTGVGVGGTISGGQLKIGAGASTGGSDNVASAVVCYGASCSLAPGSVLFSRLRKFWYKEID